METKEDFKKWFIKTHYRLTDLPNLPEGWYDLAYNSICVDQEGQEELLVKSCTFLKEMAEALEKVLNSDCCTYGICGKCGDKADIILKKFKEWK